MTKRKWAIVGAILLASVIFELLIGCAAVADVLPSTREQTQKLATGLETTANDIAELRQTVVNAPKQTLNELWPWIILLLGLAAMALLGVPLILFGIAWLVRKWVVKNSYVGQFEKIAELKKKACNGLK